MKKRKKMCLALLSSVSVIASFYITNLFNHNVESYAWGVGNNVKTIAHWDGRTPGIGSPTYITFNPKYRDSKGQPSPQYNAYGSSTKFWEEFYRNEFHWYSIVPRHNPTAEEMNMQRMLENRQTKLGKNGAYLVNSNYSLNLKKGRSDPYIRKYMGDNIGIHTSGMELFL